MSRFRRIGLAATAAAAVLALAVPTGASAISINTGPTGSGWYNVTGTGNNAASWTFFMMTAPGMGGQTAVKCLNGNNGMPVASQHGWGIADGQERTLFVPAFQQPHPTLDGGCWFVDHNGDVSNVSIPVAGALALALTGLAPGQNPSEPRRKYSGRLFFYQSFGMSFVPAKYPGCVVRIVGPQSADLPASPYGQIVVDDNADQIDMDVSGATFAATKTAACPSTIGNSVKMHQMTGPGWRLNNVTVTP